MKRPELMPPFVLAGGRWYLVTDWEMGREHGPATIRPLTERELVILNMYIDDLLTEVWALVTVLPD